MRKSIRQPGEPLLSEPFSEGYIERAPARAARRKSPWNLLLISVGFVSMAIICWMSFRLVWYTRNLLLHQHTVSLAEWFRKGPHSIISLLFLLPPLFASVAPGLFLFNLVVWCIAPARRAVDREEVGVWHASFANAQKDLFTLTLYTSVPALLLSLFGALLLHL
jgi:hypothetical protein